MATKEKNIWILLIFILSGLVVGGLLGELASKVDWLWWLSYNQVFGLENPIVLDLSVVKITFALMLYQGVPFTWHMLFIIPIFIVLYIISFGIGMILMHFGVTLNDLGNLTNIALRMVFYLSGIFYNINERLKGKLRFFLLRLNPIALCMNELRKVMLQGVMPNFEMLGIWLFIGIILCVIGVSLINDYENSYAKVI